MNRFLLIQRMLFFIAGLIAVDQAILWAGNKLVDSAYWGDPVVYGIYASPPRDAYILGTCRASLILDPQILESQTNLTYYNAGRVVDGLGNMDFTLNTILSHRKPKLIVLSLDTELLMETFPEARTDLNHREIWWQALDKEKQKILLARYHYNNFFLFSGIWKFRGLGENLLKAAARMATHKATPAKDAYDPYPVEPNLSGKNLNEKYLQTQVRLQATITNFSIESISNFIEEIRKSGAKAVIVIPPMHRLYANALVNEETVLAIEKIAKKNNTLVLNHLTDTAFANEDAFWTNTSHMNRAGAEKFSRILASELRGANL